MATELFLGCLIVLSVAAAIIVAMTKHNRIDYVDEDRPRRSHGNERRPRQDRKN